MNSLRELVVVPSRRAAWIDPWPLTALAVAAAAGLLFATRPLAVQLAAVALLALPLLLSPRVRVLFVVVGAVTVFGPAELTTPKLAFLLGAAVAFAGSFAHARAFTAAPAYRVLSPLFGASYALFALIAVSLPVALWNDVPRQEWLREVAPYVLLACAPFFAFDAQAAFGVRGLRRLIAVVGLAAAGAFMINWYVNRSLTAEITEGFGLATFMLGGALFAFAIAMAIDAQRARLRWLGLGALVFAMMASTGTRSSLAFLAAPLGIIAGTNRHFAHRSIRLLVLVPIAAALVVVSGYTLFRIFDADQDVYRERVELLFRSGDASDQSYLERKRLTEAAWRTFRQSPLTGTGPGSLIEGPGIGGRRFSTPIVDSPAGFLVDFGLVGIVVLGALVVLFGSSARRMRLLGGVRTTGQLALLGFAAIVVARAVLQVPFEDKGLAIAFLLLLAIATREAVDARQRLERVPPA